MKRVGGTNHPPKW